ncbi:MAG: 1-acyl-sn-glycerol-3-phosphate acyltransferase [Spirochaetales bacterium]|nr:1-acyl-sn-glycerol-3-phosphate acyltransferase [Spirochaetales bacterium]
MLVYYRAKSLARLLSQPIDGMSFTARLLVRSVLFLSGALVEIHSDQPLPKDMPQAIYAVNHSSAFDAFLIPCFLAAYTGRGISFFIHWMYKYIPLVGWLMKHIDPVWVYNRETSIKWLAARKKRNPENPVEEAIGKLNAGRSIGIFPEGTRNRDPEKLLRGRLGTGEMMLSTGMLVVPVGVDFPKRIKRGKIPKIGRCIIRVGKPISFSEEQKTREQLLSDATIPARERKRKMMDIYHAVSNRVMSAIAPLCGKRYDAY